MATDDLSVTFGPQAGVVIEHANGPCVAQQLGDDCAQSSIGPAGLGAAKKQAIRVRALSACDRCGGRTLTPFAELEDDVHAAALTALAAAVQRGIVKRLNVERVAGASALGSVWEERLVAAGFRTGPKRLSLG